MRTRTEMRLNTCLAVHGPDRFWGPPAETARRRSGQPKLTGLRDCLPAFALCASVCFLLGVPQQLCRAAQSRRNLPGFSRGAFGRRTGHVASGQITDPQSKACQPRSLWGPLESPCSLGDSYLVLGSEQLCGFLLPPQVFQHLLLLLQ